MPLLHWQRGGSRCGDIHQYVIAVQQLCHAPTLRLGQRTRLYEPDDVADLVSILFVVGVESLHAAHGLAIQRMADTAFDGDYHRLVHHVAHDAAHSVLTVCCSFRHDALLPIHAHEQRSVCEPTGAWRCETP